VLWDVDHTLIDNGGVSKANYALAFELLTGRRPDVDAQTGGRTDVEIVESLLRDNGEDPAGFTHEQQWSALADAGVRNMDLLRQRGHALPGAAAALERLSYEEHVHQSLLTGNIEANARVKLGAFGLDKWVDFATGAFGTESRVRAELVPVAQRKTIASRSFDPEHDVTILGGDTPRDVQAGIDGGARVIAVATGGVSVAELEEAGADLALIDLTDVDQVLAAVEKVRRLGPIQRRAGSGE